jgi:hypothetical protein
MKAINNRVYSDFDNCLICKDSDIKKNDVAKFIRWIGFTELADKIDLMFPVVLCKRSDNKYVANPMTKPRWCTKK